MQRLNTMHFSFKLLLIPVILSGCVSSASFQQVADSAKFPSPEVKQILIKAARDTLYDPYSIRDAEISDTLFVNNRIWVCVKANAKNRLGGYTGRTALGVAIRDNVIIASAEGDPWCFNPALRWHPFKELESLRNL